MGKEIGSIVNFKHGKTDTREYHSWCSAKDRCYNPYNKKFPSYGVRGIAMADRWRNSFLNFLEDMGKCPEGHTLERVNNDGNYEPQNCIWTKPETQSRNTRRTRFLTYNGETKTLPEWAEHLSMNRQTLWARLNSGNPLEKIINDEINMGLFCDPHAVSINSDTYRIWSGIKTRCYNQSHHDYKDYGGKGVKMADKWKGSYEEFLKDVGPRPYRYSLDRINSKGDYEPGNVRWTTPKEQANNKKKI